MELLTSILETRLHIAELCCIKITNTYKDKKKKKGTLKWNEHHCNRNKYLINNNYNKKQTSNHCLLEKCCMLYFFKIR